MKLRFLGSSSPPSFSWIFWSWVGGFWESFNRANRGIIRWGGIPLSDRFFRCVCSTCVWGASSPFFSATKSYWRSLCICPCWSIRIFLLGDQSIFACPLAVSLAIVAMQLTGTVHPPGGATALISVIGGSSVHQLGYWYVLCPVGLGACIMVGVL